VTARGNNRQRIFRDDADRHVFMRLFARVVDRFGWSCLTYCLMDNHYHLLLLTPEPTLGAGMQRLNGSYAQGFNQRHRQSGRVWGDRYFSRPLQRDAHLLEAIRYIAWNPVRAGLCERPEHWQWSGHQALLGLAPAGIVSVESTLAYFAADGGDPGARYRSFVRGTVPL
jgi:REP element-mobilizing transposase RayT